MSTSDIAISVRGVCKDYQIAHQEKHTTLGEKWMSKLRSPLAAFRTPPQETFKALCDVSFDVKKGEVVGIIGRNGAGKSTLLKILSRITEPTGGEIKLYGRIASLLEVGTGFHPELTGRENIYLNGAIMGMKRAEISRKFDEIVAFAEVEKFLDTAVKRYSSGMYVRLAFAVAAHLEPEILIVDEVLAVGDAEFQKKCLGKMKEVAKGEGRTVLFVSHNMGAISTLCTSGVVLSQGQVTLRGSAGDAVEAYLSSSCSAHVSSEWERGSVQAEPPPLCLERVEVRLEGDQPFHRLQVSVKARSYARHQPAFVAVDFFDLAGAWLMQAVPQVKPFINCSEGNHEFSVFIDLPPLIPGSYRVGVWLGASFSVTLDERREIVSFDISDSPTVGRTVLHGPARGYVVPVSQLRQSSITSERMLI